jgi:hypothetical protein
MPRSGPRLALPEKAKAFSVPPNESVRLHNEQGALPCSQPTRQQHEQGSVSVLEMGSFDLTAQNYELLAQ